MKGSLKNCLLIVGACALFIIGQTGVSASNHSAHTQSFLQNKYVIVQSKPNAMATNRNIKSKTYAGKFTNHHGFPTFTWISMNKIHAKAHTNHSNVFLNHIHGNKAISGKLINNVNDLKHTLPTMTNVPQVPANILGQQLKSMKKAGNVFVSSDHQTHTMIQIATVPKNKVPAVKKLFSHHSRTMKKIIHRQQKMIKMQQKLQQKMQQQQAKQQSAPIQK